MEKTFWCAETKFFDNGKVTARIHSSVCGSKPQDTQVETALSDAYEDWFDTEAEARAWIAEVKST